MNACHQIVMYGFFQKIWRLGFVKFALFCVRLISQMESLNPQNVLAIENNYFPKAYCYSNEKDAKGMSILRSQFARNLLYSSSVSWSLHIMRFAMGILVDLNWDHSISRNQKLRVCCLRQSNVGCFRSTYHCLSSFERLSIATPCWSCEYLTLRLVRSGLNVFIFMESGHWLTSLTCHWFWPCLFFQEKCYGLINPWRPLATSTTYLVANLEFERSPNCCNWPPIEPYSPQNFQKI